MTARPDKPLAEHTAEQDAIRNVAHAICRSGKFETGQGGCAALCMSIMGSSRGPHGCEYAPKVHADLASACVNALAGIPDPAALRASHDALVEALSYSEPYIETLHSLLLQNGGKEDVAVKLCWKAIKKARQALATAKELSA